MPRPKTLEEPEHGWPLGWGASLREFRTFVTVERGLSPHTAAGYLSDLNHLAVWACGRELPAPDLTRDHLTAFLVAQQSEGKAPRSLARLSSSLRAFLSFLRMEGGDGAGPEAVVKPPRPPRILPRTLGESQVEALLGGPGHGHTAGRAGSRLAGAALRLGPPRHRVGRASGLVGVPG